MNSFSSNIIKKSKQNFVDYNNGNYDYLIIDGMLKELDLYILQQNIKNEMSKIDILIGYQIHFYETLKF